MNATFNNNQWNHLKLKGNNGTKESKLIYFEKSSKSYIPLPVYFYLRLIFPFFPVFCF